jgi:RNA polymerase sigma-70 factor (ECF subfamily)
VLSIARRVTGHASDADDVAQESFLRIYGSLGRVDPSRPLEPWIVRITLNVARTFVERRRARGALVAPGVAGGPVETPPVAEARAAAGDLRHALHEALQTLPERERLVFELRELEGMETAAVAESLDVSPITVRRQVMGARTKLTAWFRKHRPELVPGVAGESSAGRQGDGTPAASAPGCRDGRENDDGDERSGDGPGKNK